MLLSLLFSLSNTLNINLRIQPTEEDHVDVILWDFTKLKTRTNVIQLWAGTIKTLVPQKSALNILNTKQLNFSLQVLLEVFFAVIRIHRVAVSNAIRATGKFRHILTRILNSSSERKVDFHLTQLYPSTNSAYTLKATKYYTLFYLRPFRPN
jgi:hypothetical protein